MGIDKNARKKRNVPFLFSVRGFDFEFGEPGGDICSGGGRLYLSIDVEDLAVRSDVDGVARGVVPLEHAISGRGLFLGIAEDRIVEL
jgi:hypothetical protein